MTTYSFKNPDVSNDYDPEYLKFFLEVYAPAIDSKVKDIGDTFDKLSDVDKSRKLAHVRHSVDQQGVYLPVMSFKDTIDIQDDVIPSIDGYHINIRVYKPKTLKSDNAAYINFHGGGWLIGDLSNDSSQNYWLVHLSNITIIDVEYRLIPDWEFATPFYDAYTAIKYIKLHGYSKFGIDPNKIAIGGTSAGGKIALSAALMTRDLKIPVQLVLANVPVIEDFSKVRKVDDLIEKESAIRYYDDPVLPFTSMTRFGEYAKKADREGRVIDLTKIEDQSLARLQNLDKYYGNLLESNISLKGLPPHLISVGETDILRDGAKAYAKMLIDANVDVQLRIAYGLGHSHNKFTNVLKKSKTYLYLLADYLKKLQRGDFTD